MAVSDRLADAIRALLGVSAYQKPKGYGPELDSALVEEVRANLGGQIQPLPTTKLRWYLADLEQAQASADAGNLRPAAQLLRAKLRDGVLAGLLGTRSAGLVRLPKRFYGDAEIIQRLEGDDGGRTVFDEMFPPAELARMTSDGIDLGISVGEMMPVEGRDYPVLVRLDPEFLQYRWAENRWYFLSIAGALPITPGDGRWILHLPGARLQPWTSGLWPALGRSFINKEHAILHRSNYSAKLANPARVAVSPLGGAQVERTGMLRRLMAWGINTVFDLPVGWDVKLVESNGRGIEVFQKEIDTSDLEYMVAVAGQLVTTTGGSGFQNADVFRSIREDLIKNDGESLAYTINTQGLPKYIADHFGIDAITKRATRVEWDTKVPKELEAEARTFLSLAQALAQLAEVLQGTDKRVNLDELATRFALPLVSTADETEGAAASSAPELTVPQRLSQPSIRAAVGRLVKYLPAAARRLSVEELAGIVSKAA